MWIQFISSTEVAVPVSAAAECSRHEGQAHGHQELDDEIDEDGEDGPVHWSSDDDDDGERASELGVEEGETFFDFDEEGFIDDAIYQLKCEIHHKFYSN